MIIGIDYDFTYTLDPSFWDMVIQNAQLRGHTVVRVGLTTINNQQNQGTNNE